MAAALRSFGVLAALVLGACSSETPPRAAPLRADSAGVAGSVSNLGGAGGGVPNAGGGTSAPAGGGVSAELGGAAGAHAAVAGAVGTSAGGAGGATTAGSAGTAGGGGGSGRATGGVGSGMGGALAASGGAVAAGAGGVSVAGASGLGPPGPDGFAIKVQLASDIKSTAPTTVGIVTWSLDEPGLTAAHIDFGLDTTYGMKAPVDLTLVDDRTVLVGMKPAKTYHFRIVATDGSNTFTSADQTLTTGAATTLIPAPTVSVTAPDQADKGFIISSFWNNSWTVFIMDTDGDIVWWYTDTANSGTLSDGIGRARLSADSHDVWLVTGQIANPLRRVSIDTLDVQIYPDATGTHDICAVSGDTMAYLASTTPETCATVTEIDKAGSMKPIFDSTPVAGEKCHGNAIRYVTKQDLYVFSDRNTDVYVLDRAGTVKWKLSDKVSGGHASWGGVQHGVQLLDASILIFANEAAGAGDFSHSQAMEFGLDGSVIQKFSSHGATDWFGDVQRLPSGNTLINYSLGPIEEVDANDNVVLTIGSLSYSGYSEFRPNLYGPAIDVQP